MSAMRKVVERLQNENSSLKKSLTNARAKKGGHTDKTVAALEEENNKLKVFPPKIDMICIVGSISPWYRMHVHKRERIEYYA